MTHDETTLVIERMFDAPAEAVFDAWMTREQWQAWVGPEGMDCAVPLLEPRVGGRYEIEMRMSDGSIIPVTGVFEVIDRPRALRFTWGWAGDPDRQSVITLTFREAAGRTHFTLCQEGLKTVANRDAHRQGWTSALRKLERFLAERVSDAAHS